MESLGNLLRVQVRVPSGSYSVGVVRGSGTHNLKRHLKDSDAGGPNLRLSRKHMALESSTWINSSLACLLTLCFGFFIVKTGITASGSQIFFLFKHNVCEVGTYVSEGHFLPPPSLMAWEV